MAQRRTHEEVFQELKSNDLSYALFRSEQASEDVLLDAMISARLAAGLTQTDLAKKMGVRQSVISRMESGDYDLRFSTIQRYANATGQTINLQVAPVVYPENAAPPVAKAS